MTTQLCLPVNALAQMEGVTVCQLTDEYLYILQKRAWRIENAVKTFSAMPANAAAGWSYDRDYLPQAA